MMIHLLAGSQMGRPCSGQFLPEAKGECCDVCGWLPGCSTHHSEYSKISH